MQESLDAGASTVMSKHGADPMSDNEPMDDGPCMYGGAWAPALALLTRALQHNAADIVKRFYCGLIHLPKSKHTLAALSEQELQHLKAQQIQNLYRLASPELTEIEHRTMALRIGRIHAIVGLEWQDLIRSRGMLSAAIHERLDTSVHASALALLGRRLTQGLAWQSEAYQRLQTSRQNVLLRLTRLAWDVESYTDLIDRVVRILGEHDEVAGCSVGRPDSRGIFRFESVSGRTIERYLAELESSANPPILDGNRPQGQGPAARAWRSANVERCVNMATDPLMAPWKDAALREGFRSSVAIPLRQPGHPPKAILSLYSPFPGGYSAADQMAFITLLQTLLELAIARIENQQGHSHAVPYATRQHWTGLLRSDGLYMDYQPLMDLKTGRITQVEALARLRDGNRALMPGEFFPALSSDDFFELYDRGLAQVLSQRNRWLQDGIELKVSVNVPSSALGDNRYLDATRKALADYACPPDMLTLEILETDALPLGMDVSGVLAKFKLLGVNLAEDDLGSGHSSLSRLRELPFDSVKIDRNIVSVAGQDPSNVLRFVYQLTRLGRSLGKSVTVEGIEDAGMLEAIVILGADVAQGYAIGRPMPAQELVAWMGKQRRLPDPLTARSALGKLATLLIWEERLHLICEDPRAPARLSDIVNNPAGSGCALPTSPKPLDPTCRVCPVSSFHSDADSILPALLADRGALQPLLAAAWNHGPDSVAYRSARERLVTAIMRGTAEH